MKKEINVGLLIFTAIILLITLSIGFRLYKIHTNTYPLTFIFPETDGLKTNDAITCLGVKIGHVKKMETDVNKVYVNVLINNNNKIPVDSRIKINRIGLFTDNEISVSPGNSNEYCKANDTIKHSIADKIPSFNKIADVTNSLVGVGNIMLQKEIISKLDTIITLLREKN